MAMSVNRFTGMYSGMDTESIVKSMLSKETAKQEKLQTEQVKIEWRQDAWGTLNTALKSFLSNKLKDLKNSDAYKTDGVFDPEKILKKVESFIEGYNKILTELQKVYNSSSGKSYSPLTEAQKNKMTDTQINNWETAGKSSILYRDSSLGNIIHNYKGVMGTFDLSDLGLTSSSYTIGGDPNARGIYTIDEEVLTKAIENDPEGVVKKITSAANALYNNTTSQMRFRAGVSSNGTIFNDIAMNKQKNTLASQEYSLTEHIAKMEDKYYKQFAQMEKMLAVLQNQNNSLMNIFG